MKSYLLILPSVFTLVAFAKVPAPLGEWTYHLRQGSNAYVTSVAQSSEGYLAVGDFGSVWRSQDGVEWEHHFIDRSDSLRKLQWAGNLWLAEASNSVLVSVNGLDWQEVLTAEYDLKDFALAEGTLAALERRDRYDSELLDTESPSRATKC